MFTIDTDNKLANPFQTNELTSTNLNLFPELETNYSSNNIQTLRTILGQMQALMSSRFKELSKKCTAASSPPAEFVVTEAAVKDPSKKLLRSKVLINLIKMCI